LRPADAAGQRLERIADVPIYATDAIVRRSVPLQMTNDAAPPKAWISVALSRKLGVAEGARLKVTQGKGSAVLTAGIDSALPDSVVRVAAAHESTKTLGAMFGPVTVEKA
jgi:NADH-quinone oxidoreductase subunit G